MPKTAKSSSISSHPFFSIFLAPVQTLDRLHKDDHSPLTLLFIVANGLMIALFIVEAGFMAGQHTQTSFSFMVMTIVLILLLALPFGIINFQVQSWLLHQTGGWLDGKASQEDIEKTYLWSLAPILPLAVLHLVSFFSLAAPNLMTFPILIAMLWMFFILAKGLAAVQDFPLWKALANIALTFLVPALLFIPIPLLVSLL